MITKRLYDFLKDWYSWATSECISSDYNPSIGLCNSIADYCNYDTLIADECYEDLISEFKKDGLDLSFPFEEKDYTVQSTQGMIHKCPKRLAWVEGKIKEYEENVIG